MSDLKNLMLGSIEDDEQGDLVPDLLKGRFIPIHQYSQLVEKHNKLVDAFKRTRRNELDNQHLYEAALAMIAELTNRDREDIISNDLRGKYWRDDRVVAQADKYAQRRAQDDQEAGIL